MRLLSRRKLRRAVAIAFVIATLALVGFAFGWFAGPRGDVRVAPAFDGAPRLVHVVGWNGPVAGDRAFLTALRAGGCPHAMETFDWTDGHNGLPALWHAQRSDESAARLADRLVTLARRSPDRPIDVTADSSGCGVALAALARLPDDVRVRTVVLSSPAVSAGYDLAPALAHVDRRIVAYRSGRDWLILGLGTSLFGTVDNAHASGAGRHGFATTPPNGKLEQIDVDAAAPSWRVTGHSISMSPTFAREHVARLQLDDHSTRAPDWASRANR